MVKNKWSERERMDGLLLDKYCETWWRDGAVFIADININFPGVALLAQRGLNTGKLERKFSEPQGRGIKEPWLRDPWHTELFTDPTTLSYSLVLSQTYVHGNMLYSNSECGPRPWWTLRWFGYHRDGSVSELLAINGSSQKFSGPRTNEPH